jgi:hypothetical protein
MWQKFKHSSANLHRDHTNLGINLKFPENGLYFIELDRTSGYNILTAPRGINNSINRYHRLQGLIVNEYILIYIYIYTHCHPQNYHKQCLKITLDSKQQHDNFFTIWDAHEAI